jgi:inhibitor of cysteine peptidase
MNKRMVLLISMVLLGFLLTLTTGCGSAGEVRLTGKADVSQVELKVGQELVIELESNPTTGYSWEVDEIDPTILQQDGEAVYQDESDDAELVGGGGTETFTFKATSTGETTLTLVYHRPWEEGVEPLETFSVEVMVR